MSASLLLQRLPDASAALKHMLDPARGALAPMLRAEVYGPQGFAEHGRRLGQTQQASWERPGEGVFFPRLRSNIEVLRQSHQYIGAQAAQGQDISPAAEWLLDNFHLIEAQIHAVKEGLPRSYFRTLPTLQSEPLAGLPRVYGLAWAFVVHTDGAFDEELLCTFLQAYQEVQELKLSELWAISTTLRVILIESLRRLAERVACNKAARELANLCCDHDALCNRHAMDALLHELNQRGVGAVFLGQMVWRLGPDTIPPDTGHQSALQTWLQQALQGLTPAQTQAQQDADQAADNLSVSNAVTSLRAIGDADWVGLVARTSKVMRLMLGTPLFAAEESATRDQTLHAIEQLARRSLQTEMHVTEALLSLMQSPKGRDAHPHEEMLARHWFQGAGRSTLLARIGLSKDPVWAWRRLFRKQTFSLYVLAFVASCALVLAWLGQHDRIGTLSTWARGGLLVLLALPVSEAVLALMNRLISESTRPQHLPRLALLAGIPIEHRVLVVIPCLLTDPTTTQALVHRLHLHHLANPELHAQFALLTDTPDADEIVEARDEALLSEVMRHVQALNQAHPTPAGEGNGPRFIVLHRARSFSPSEQRWMGWERKRGKLHQLVQALATGQSPDFVDLGELSHIAPHTPYIVTLDADTELPPGRLRALVGVAAHPANLPQLDAQQRIVTRGHGILQPRMVTRLPQAHERSAYHWLFAGRCGLDTYSAAVSEVYQDLFGEGSFHGKGLLNVAAVHGVLSNSLPDGAVLSHDLLEGSMARCAAVSDITLMEDAPSHADVAATRVERWTRGDWQLMPFLLRPGPLGLRGLHVWKMTDNLRRSLVAPACMALLVLALWGAGPTPWLVLGVVVAAMSAGPLIGALAGLSAPREDLALLPFHRHSLTEMGRVVGGTLWQLALLPHQTATACEAIARTWWRLLVSRRHLLQWVASAHVAASSNTELGVLVRRHAREPGVAAAIWLSCLLLGSQSMPLATALCLLWAGTPWWVWLVSRPRQSRLSQRLSEADQQYLTEVAHDTWRYFERCVTADERHLPPDNLQTVPFDTIAHRTSPTNVGLYLVSACCAREFGWIDTLDLVQRLETTLHSLGQLQQHRGHWLNWYDTQTGQALLPHYISTVDSGNLSACLLAVGQACEALTTPALLTQEAQGVSTHARLKALALQCEQWAWQADYQFLLHPKRHLMHIGYRLATDELDDGLYDLLASEARLASLVAMAKGDVPVRHWAALSRPYCAVDSRAGLLSWSGSMFEYLMPGLLIEEPWGSALQVASDVAVQVQMQTAARLGVPWGMSESAYAGRDDTLAYQYAPQGVASLALRRPPSGELVIAPYATLLAAPLAPQAACNNLRRLEALGARGRYGFIEALDYSPSRQLDNSPCTLVHTSMAHHQGMGIVALANVLLGGVAQRWGMGHPRLQAIDTLLQEWSPHEVSTRRFAPPAHALSHSAGLPMRPQRELLPGQVAIEPTQWLSNSRYHVSLRANGAGWSRWGATGISRWRDDALRDACGHFFYLRMEDAPGLHSLTLHPAGDPRAHHTATFHPDRVCFETTWPDLVARITVWVSPEDDIECREVELLNLSDQSRELSLVSAFEVALSDPRADEAHPAFSNLFVQAQWRPAQQALVFERKPRLSTEPGMHAAHFLSDVEATITSVHAQTDRARWLGRNHDVSQPLAEFMDMSALPTEAPSALDTGLDPMCALSVRVHLAPHAKARLTFATAASDQASTLMAVIDKHRQPSHVQRSSMMSATMAAIRWRTLKINPEHTAAMQSLSTALAMNLSRVAWTPGVSKLRTPRPSDKRLLWHLGLSGERALLLVSVGTPQGLGLVRSLTQALQWWSWAGLPCDLVIVNEEPSSYQMNLQRELNALRNQAVPALAGNGLHLLHRADVAADVLATLHALARVHLVADGRALPHLFHAWLAAHEEAREHRANTHSHPVPMLGVSRNGRHGVSPSSWAFRDEGRLFAFSVGATQRPPKPWLNVLSNPGFGTQVSESGSGYTWAINSRLHQLTAWSNDAVGDPPSEWLLLQDLKTRQAWSLSPSAWGASGALYEVTHGQGFSRITHSHDGLRVSVTWCVDMKLALKQVQVQVTNLGPRVRHLRVVAMAEWLLGAQRADRAGVHTEHLQQTWNEQPLTTLLATQMDASDGFGQSTAFLQTVGEPGEPADWTCDRRELFNAMGQIVLPDRFEQLDGRGLDPCAALSSAMRLLPGQALQRVFHLGHAATPEAAQALALQACQQAPYLRRQATVSHWNECLEACSVRTPDAMFDALVNRWLLYQAVSCRLWAKAGFYQAGGATGFRDQLQDAMALCWARPELLRAQIIEAASRQFMAGDVQHWWHAPSGAGVRTHFSDDLLWLPHACAHHLRITGDGSVLDVVLPFLEGTPIPPGAEDSYNTPTLSEHKASVYEHAARTLDHSLRVGVHDLPLMGSGDWNDGMNRVGHEGHGESVWLAWFLCDVVNQFAPIAEGRGEATRAKRWREAAQGWQTALNAEAGPVWDGQWFTRAFFDNGQALGSAQQNECRIDLIAQAWSVLSGVASLSRQTQAMASVDAHLVDHEHGLIRLLTPPFAHADPSPGYIQAYPPGVRENGGQYAHAGVWAVMAAARLAHQSDTPELWQNRAYHYFTCLSPAHRASHPRWRESYGLEPYVMAGDVYSEAPWAGRGGWSWYTGSAAWMHRAAIESIFGLSLGGVVQGPKHLSLNPCLPTHWPRAEMVLQREGRRMRFILIRATPAHALATALQPAGPMATAETLSGARLLRPAQVIDWGLLPAESCFVVPLLQAP